MAQVITDIDNHETFKQMFSFIDENSQQIPDAVYMNLMGALMKLRLDIKKTINDDQKCVCSGNKFCIDSIDKFITCSNLNYILDKSNILYYLLPLHKRTKKIYRIQLYPNTDGIIIDYDVDMFDKSEISQVILQLINFVENTKKYICNKVNYMSRVIIAIAIYDIIYKYFILFINEKEFLNMCIFKMDEFITYHEIEFKQVFNMIKFKGHIIKAFKKHLIKYI